MRMRAAGMVFGLTLLMGIGAESASAQLALELRGGVNIPTFKITDAAKAGASFGAGLQSKIGTRTWLLVDLDMGMHKGAEVAAGINGPDIDVGHLIGKVGYQVGQSGSGMTIMLNAGAGVMRFAVDGGSSYTYPAINVGAKVIYPLGNTASFVLSPQGDIAFSKKSEVGTTNAWVWPISAGLRFTF